MTSIMLTISFLIHIAFLMIIYYLFNEIKQLKKNTPQNMTHIFEKYLQEIRNENDRLKSDIPPGIDKPKTKQVQHNFVESESQTLYMPELVETEDISETTIQAQILQMYHQGYSPGEIAKRLDCGDTEVALTIKFNGKRNLKT